MTSLAAITLQKPEGSAWEFLVLFLVVIIGPPLMQRARVPGLIGLLIGGFLIGPHGFGLLDAGSTTIPDLGQLGLLYLMFVAGVELDLGLLKRYRNGAITFGLLTFALPDAVRHDRGPGARVVAGGRRCCSARCSRRTRSSSTRSSATRGCPTTRSSPARWARPC